jgi:DNA-directed RNA polymerase specialized sigma24 family protein
VLRYYENWSIPEIAAALGISRGAASSSLNRALNSLNTSIGAANADH